jgi:hypothetical protein
MRAEGREESTAGPWLLGIILLALVVWVASVLASNDSQRIEYDAPPVQPLASSAAFSDWVRDSAAVAQRTLPPREFVTAALRRMTLAFSGVVSHAAPALAPDMERLDSDVSAFVADTTDGISHVRVALDTALELMRSLREELPPAAAPGANGLDGALERAHDAVAAVPAEGSLEVQTPAIERALHELAGALQLIARRLGAP